jgi:hypothetical protein
MTTNQGTEMASLNDEEATVEDAALTDHENEEALDSPIDLLNMVNLCDNTKKCGVAFTRQVKGKRVKVAYFRSLQHPSTPSVTKTPPMVRQRITRRAVVESESTALTSWRTKLAPSSNPLSSLLPNITKPRPDPELAVPRCLVLVLLPVVPKFLRVRSLSTHPTVMLSTQKPLMVRLRTTWRSRAAESECALLTGHRTKLVHSSSQGPGHAQHALNSQFCAV